MTVYGYAEFSERVERPTKDYVVPNELKPRKTDGGSGFETLDQSYQRIQIGMALEGERMAKVMADAKKKGKLETVTIYGAAPRVADVVFDLKNLPKR